MRTLTPYWTSRSLASGLFDEMDRFISTFDKENSVGAYDERNFVPACEVTEGEEHYLMSVDLPGMKKEDIKIEINENTLTISGERKREMKSDGKDRVQRYERSYGFFKRSFGLPTTVDAEKVEARYESGVLELYLPKTPTAKPRTVQIQSENNAGFFGRILGSKESNT